LPAGGYRLTAIPRLDGRTHRARELKQRRAAFDRDQAAYLRASRRDRLLELEAWLERQAVAAARGDARVDDNLFVAGLNVYVGLIRQIEAAPDQRTDLDDLLDHHAGVS
jgi:hypothetical protein